MRDFFIRYVDAVVQRRSYYLLEDRAVVDDSHVVKLVDELLMVMPSPFNVQSARVVLLLGEHHRQLWQFVAEALYPLISEERFQATKRKIELSFASGHGTLLFYEDVAALNKLREHYPAYANNVDVWSEQSSGMLQFAMWTGLEAMGYGASLQHYGNLIHHAVAERWQINPDWRLVAEMPFGAALDTPKERVQTTPPVSRRLIYGMNND